LIFAVSYGFELFMVMGSSAIFPSLHEANARGGDTDRMTSASETTQMREL
jgi:hypothetical protein